MFWYYVAPYAGERWNILFENQPKPYIYDSQEEALKAAEKAAASNHKKTGKPSGVRIKTDGGWTDGETFGEE